MLIYPMRATPADSCCRLSVPRARCHAADDLFDAADAALMPRLLVTPSRHEALVLFFFDHIAAPTHDDFRLIDIMTITTDVDDIDYRLPYMSFFFFAARRRYVALIICAICALECCCAIDNIRCARFMPGRRRALLPLLRFAAMNYTPLR